MKRETHGGTVGTGRGEVLLVILATFMFLGVVSVSADTVVLLEDFENEEGPAYEKTYTTSVTEFSDGSEDFFGRVDADLGISHSGGVVYHDASGALGGGYFAAMDLDGEGAVLPLEIEWTDLDITGLGGLWFSADFATDDSSAGNWDRAADYVLVEYRIGNGAWSALLRFENDDTQYNTGPLEDTNFDEVGDGTALTSTFATLPVQATPPASSSNASMIPPSPSTSYATNSTNVPSAATYARKSTPELVGEGA